MKVWIAVGVLAIALVGILVLQTYAFGPSDEEKVVAAMEEAIEAARNGEAGPVLDLLSRRMTFNEATVTNRTEIARYIRLAQPEFEVHDPRPVIYDETAHVVSPVTVRFTIMGNTQSSEIPQVRLEFERELTTRYLILPVSRWRLTTVESPSVPLPNIGTF